MRKWIWLKRVATVFNYAAGLGLVYLVYTETGIWTGLAVLFLLVKMGPFITITVSNIEHPVFDRSEIKPLNIVNLNSYLRRRGPVN
jgi:hypothetical protein